MTPAEIGKYRITMADGREITLDAIYQRETYAGLLEGWPTQELNDEVLEQDVTRAGSRMNVSHAAVLISPELKLWREPTLEEGVEPGVRQLLPAIATYAVFESNATARDEGCASAALFVWYQELWGLPSLAIVEAIELIDWDRIAVDFDY